MGGWGEALEGALEGLALMLFLLPPPGLAAPEAASERLALSCLSAAPSLAWFGGGSPAGPARLDRLNCSATDALTGRVSSASVLLGVQPAPGPSGLALEAHFAEATEPGLLLVLLVLLRASPPGSLSWEDADGRPLPDADAFLLLDATALPVANHSLRLQLHGPAWNASFTAAVTPAPGPGFLDTRVELPLLALVAGGTAALGTLLALGVLLGCLVCRKGKAAAGLPLAAQLPLSTSDHPKPEGAQLPRANRSLPANLRLNDFAPKAAAQVQQGEAAGEQEGEAFSEPEDSLALAQRGLGQFPMVGYIYRASSMSSDEVWL